MRFTHLCAASWSIYAETAEQAIERMLVLFDTDEAGEAEARRTAVADYRGPYTG